MQKSLQYCLVAVCACLFCSCSSRRAEFEWTPVRVVADLPEVDVHEVLVMTQVPSAKHVRVGYIAPPKGKMIRVSLKDKELLDYFKEEAAEMGANTVALINSRLRYKSGAHSGTRVDLFLVSEEEGSHGGDELSVGDGVIPMNALDGEVRLY